MNLDVSSYFCRVETGKNLPFGLCLGTALVTAAFLAMLTAPFASGSTGVISAAEASADWTTADLAGSASWEGCEILDPLGPEPAPGSSGYLEDCAWRPFATIGAGSSSADCSLPGRLSPGDLGPGVILAWEGWNAWEPGTQPFAVDELSLEEASGHLVCLSALEKGPTHCHVGELDWVCEPAVPQSQVLAAALLTAPEKPPPVPQPALPAFALSPSEVRPAASPRKRCRRRASSARSLRVKRCEKHHGRHVNVARNRKVSIP